MQQKHSGSLISALVVAFLDNFGFSLVFILFAPLVLDPAYGFFSNEVAQGTKNIFLGILVGAFPIFMLFGAPFWGDYADRFGRKSAFILTLLGTVGGHLLSAAAIFSGSFLFLVFTRCLAGFFSGNISIALATVADLSPTDAIKGRNFGIVGVMMGIGWILAMVLGGNLSNPVIPFLITAALTFLGFLLVKIWFQETHFQKTPLHFDLMKSLRDIKKALYYPEMRPFLIVLFFWSLGWFFTFQWFTAISLEKYSVSQSTASLYLIVLGLFWMIGGTILNPLLVKKFNPRALSIASIFLTTFFITASCWTTHYFAFSVLFCFSALSAPVSFSNILNLVSISAPNGLQGTAMGFTQSYQALAGALVPIIGGILAKWNISSIFPIGGGLLALSVLILLIYPLHKKT
jgi:MFS family permease